MRMQMKAKRSSHRKLESTAVLIDFGKCDCVSVLVGNRIPLEKLIVRTNSIKLIINWMSKKQ